MTYAHYEISAHTNDRAMLIVSKTTTDSNDLAEIIINHYAENDLIVRVTREDDEGHKTFKQIKPSEVA